MKILAIRGSNLASLAEPFEIDLTAAPLRAAPIFMITGPVGAGKSTLLDALSVALFHRAPRLLEAGKAKAEKLPAADTRHLLRRGAKEGFAEADFQADDGARYRARWEVRRARGQTNGAVEKPSCKLFSLDTGELLIRGLTKTASEVARLLGLDFRQFQRSVLLPQGEFASFLKADPNERGARSSKSRELNCTAWCREPLMNGLKPSWSVPTRSFGKSTTCSLCTRKRCWPFRPNWTRPLSELMNWASRSALSSINGSGSVQREVLGRVLEDARAEEPASKRGHRTLTRKKRNCAEPKPRCPSPPGSRPLTS